MHQCRVIRLRRLGINSWVRTLGAPLALSGTMLAAIAGCATGRTTEQGHPSGGEHETTRNALAEVRSAMQILSQRLGALETRMSTLGDKVGSTQMAVDNLMGGHRPMATAVVAHPSSGAGTDAAESPAGNDPEAGFVTDAAIQDYRKASILLEARKYPEATIAFSAFTERYPDHALAGSAQYYLGQAYFKQNDYKHAQPEFERVLTSYDRSPHVSDTLRDLADTEDALNLPEPAARHRQLLTSLFAQSPAASAIGSPHTPSPKNAPAGSQLDEPPASHPTAQNAAPTTATPPTAPISANGEKAESE